MNSPARNRSRRRRRETRRTCGTLCCGTSPCRQSRSCSRSGTGSTRRQKRRGSTASSSEGGGATVPTKAPSSRSKGLSTGSDGLFCNRKLCGTWRERFGPAPRAPWCSRTSSRLAPLRRMGRCDGRHGQLHGLEGAWWAITH